jgi:hypothetical protein
VGVKTSLIPLSVLKQGDSNKIIVLGNFLKPGKNLFWMGQPLLMMVFRSTENLIAF